MEKKRALVIDDELVVLDSVRKILAGEGYEVDVALSGREGIDRATKGNYDILLTDIRMPDIGGMRVLRDVKRTKPSLPVIMITGYASIQSSVQAMKLGAADYVEKPFTPDQLIRSVASALDTEAAREPEAQVIVHKDEILKVLERVSSDNDFIANLLYHGSDALDGYVLTGPERLAILTGDVEWIESQLGSLTPNQRKWLDRRLSAEIW